MPDPAWSAEYLWSQSPEGNGFTRTLYRTPAITENTGGQPASRNIEINSDNGDAVFLTSQIPALDSSIGVSAELQCSVNGVGDAGFELTLLDTVIMANIFESSVNLYCPTGDNGDAGINLTVATDPNTDYTLFRILIDGQKRASLYRDGLPLWELEQCPVVTKPFQRVLWWGEGGGVQAYNGFRYYNGGAVIPG